MPARPDYNTRMILNIAAYLFVAIDDADALALRLRERAEAVGARVTLYSEPGAGTQITVVWEEPA